MTTQSNNARNRWMSLTELGPEPTRRDLQASLIVLLQHDIVTANNVDETIVYTYHPHQARLLQRSARYITVVQKSMDEIAARMFRCLLVQGRCTTMELLLAALTSSPPLPTSDRYTARQQLVEALYQLVQHGFVKPAPIVGTGGRDDDNDDAEREFDDAVARSRFSSNKRVRLNVPLDKLNNDHDPAFASLLRSASHYQTTLPPRQVWHVHVAYLHAALRAYAMGRLVSDLYGPLVKSCGSLVTAALRVRCQHELVQPPSVGGAARASAFTVDELPKYIPKPVLHNIEREEGGLHKNLTAAFAKLATLRDPIVVRPAGQGAWEIATADLNAYLYHRICNQIVSDQHGIWAARVVRVLELSRGGLEEDSIAEMAMMPVKDVRQLSHALHAAHVVEFMTLNITSYSKAYGGSSGSAIGGGGSHQVHLWRVQAGKLLRLVQEQVALACWKMQLRRQNHLERGRDSRLERGQEYEEEMQEEYKKQQLHHQLGLERLYVAIHQLDDTLMVLHDF